MKKIDRSASSYSIATALVLCIATFSTGYAANSPNKDLVIKKSEITSTVKFFPVNSGGINMEIIAVKSSDGSVRTAFNTCQVCYSSGRGYFVQKNDEIICQNCGNRFKLDQIGKIKGGCNPVPIVKENKTETKDTITISAAYIAQYQPLFKKWKTR